PAQRRMLLDRGEGLASVQSGHVEVQDDQGRCRASGPRAASVQVFEKLLSVFDKPQIDVDPAFPECVTRQKTIVFIVVRHEYGERGLARQGFLPPHEGAKPSWTSKV